MPVISGLLSSAELSKGESFLRERETSFTFMKERTLREEKETKKLEEMKKMDDLKVKFEDREKRKEESEFRKEKKSDLAEDVKEKENVYHRVRVCIYYRNTSKFE